MLPMSAPPLPHTIAVELSSAHGITRFDPIFQRHCPLPSEARKTYKADRTLRPSEVDQTIPIKFWEIQVSDDPQEKWWAGCVHIRAEAIKRPILEGTELELVIKIDPSRKLSVEVFVPLLDQSFTENVYVPDPPSARSQVQSQLDVIFDRLRRINEELYAADRDDLAPTVAALTRRAEEIAEEMNAVAGEELDPDASLAPQDRLRELRMRLLQLEEQLNIETGSNTLATELRWYMPYAERVIGAHGTQTEVLEFEKLSAQYTRYTATNDKRGLRWVRDRARQMHRDVVHDQMPFWQGVLQNLKAPWQRFVNRAQADAYLAEAETADARGDLAGLRNAVNKAWELRARSSIESEMDQAAQSGLRGS
jgi:hypothetical protein